MVLLIICLLLHSSFGLNSGLDIRALTFFRLNFYSHSLGNASSYHLIGNNDLFDTLPGMYRKTYIFCIPPGNMDTLFFLLEHSSLAFIVHHDFYLFLPNGQHSNFVENLTWPFLYALLGDKKSKNVRLHAPPDIP